MSRSASQMEWTVEAFEQRPSLWKLVEELVAPSERPEIKEALGEDLVDETLDLHEEVKLVQRISVIRWILFLGGRTLQPVSRDFIQYVYGLVTFFLFFQGFHAFGYLARLPSGNWERGERCVQRVQYSMSHLTSTIFLNKGAWAHSTRF